MKKINNHKDYFVERDNLINSQPKHLRPLFESIYKCQNSQFISQINKAKKLTKTDYPDLFKSVDRFAWIEGMYEVLRLAKEQNCFNSAEFHVLENSFFHLAECQEY